MNLQYPLNDNYHAYKNIQIIKCKQNKIIIIAWNASQDEYSAIIFHKAKPCDQILPLQKIMEEVGPVNSYQQIKKEIHQTLGNYHQKQSLYGYGIVGFHKFLQGYYLTYISQVESCARIGRHKIFIIKSTAILPLFQSRSDKTTKKSEEKYFQILSQFKLQNFYFSCTYDMTNSLAKNLIRNSKQFFMKDFKDQDFNIKEEKEKTINILNYSDIFLFTHEINTEFYLALKNKRWILPIIHGFCKHLNVSMKATVFNIIVIARRSRHHAGTRYIKRGIDPNGFVANFVEIQQIVVNYTSSQDTRPICSSFVQVRGSVPTYWMQRPSIHIPKPAIQLRTDDYMYLATRKHFSDIVTRYGSLIYAINLMKTKQRTPRQSLLSKEYQNAVNFINREDLDEQSSLHYIQIDMKHHLRLDKKMFVNKIKTFAYFAILRMGIFLCMNHSSSSHEQFIQLQNGVIRANCVDCLDRTNSFQQLVGETALAIQLNRLIKQDILFQNISLTEPILNEYSKLYEEMGDLISIQYGSSLAHKQKIQKSTQSRFQFLIAITRHVNNNWNDYDRQQEMDVFLGFKPDPNGPQIWQFKPPIEHYPSKQLQKYEFNKWFQPSLQKFIKSHFIKQLKKINNKEDYQRNLPQIERFGKDQLMSKFNAEIVNSLINERECIATYQFFVMPKIILQKKVWRQKNPKSKKLQTLKQELSHSYNKMDYLKVEKQQKTTLASQKKIIKSEMPKQMKKGLLSKNSKSSNLPFLDDKHILMRYFQRMMDSQMVDEEQLKLIDLYLKGEIIDDKQIEQMVNQYQECFEEDPVQGDWITATEIQKQLKQIQANLQAKNYLNISTSDQDNYLNTKKKTMAESRQVKTMKTIQNKSMVRQNKILILQQIMKKNFSHGSIKTIQQI